MTNTSSAEATRQEENLAKIRILIVDDQKVVRAKIQEIVAPYQDLEIVGMANDGDKAIALIKSSKPDLVLMDIEMPKMNGIEVTKVISQRFPESKILVLSTHEKEEYVQKIISAGADGYILKQTPPLDFVAAIHAVHKGYSHFGPTILKKVTLVSSSPSVKVDFNKYSPQQTNSQDYCQIINDDSEKQNQGSDKKAGIVSQKNVEDSLSTVKMEEFLPPIEKWLTWGGLGVMFIFAMMLPLSSILKYKTKVRSNATIRPEGEIRLVQVQTEGRVADIFFKPGDEVKKGDTIATIDLSRLVTSANQVKKAIAQEKLQLAQLNSQMTTVDSQVTAVQLQNQAEVRAIKAELAGTLRNYQEREVEVNSQVEETTAQLKAAEATLSAAQNRYTRYQSASAQGALSKEQLAEAELEVQQQQQEIEAAKARLKRAKVALNPSQSEINRVRQSVEQAKESGLATIAALNREKEALIQQKIEVNKQLEQNIEELNQVNTDLKQTDLLATATGIISQLNLRNSGQTVQPGQEIAQIVPKNSSLEIKAVVSPQDISKVKLEQKVQMRVSACAYPDYGTLDGKISRIAQDVSQSQNNNNSPSSQSAPPFYEIFIKPNATSFGRKENKCLLQPGMEGSAEIITREETVFKFILRKVRLIGNL